MPRRKSGAAAGPTLKLRKAKTGDDEGLPICVTCSSKENNALRKAALASGEASCSRKRSTKRQSGKRKTPQNAPADCTAEADAAAQLSPPNRTADKSVCDGSNGPLPAGDVLDGAAANVITLLREVEQCTGAEEDAYFMSLNARVAASNSSRVWDAYSAKMLHVTDSRTK
jgi:hypothetical protein